MNIGIINQVLINSYKFNSKHNLTKNLSQKEKKEVNQVDMIVEIFRNLEEVLLDLCQKSNIM